MYLSVGSRPSKNDLRTLLEHDCRQTFLSQQVPVAQTSPTKQSEVEVQSARGAQGMSGPQNPVPSEVSKQKQSEAQPLRLLHVDPLQVGAEHSPFVQTPEGHYRVVIISA